MPEGLEPSARETATGIEKAQLGIVERFRAKYEQAKEVKESEQLTEWEKRKKLEEIFAPISNALQELADSRCLIKNDNKPVDIEVKPTQASVDTSTFMERCNAKYQIWIDDASEYERELLDGMQESGTIKGEVNMGPNIFVNRLARGDHSHPFDLHSATLEGNLSFGTDAEAAIDKLLEILSSNKDARMQSE